MESRGTGDTRLFKMFRTAAAEGKYSDDEHRAYHRSLGDGYGPGAFRQAIGVYAD